MHLLNDSCRSKFGWTLPQNLATRDVYALWSKHGFSSLCCELQNSLLCINDDQRGQNGPNFLKRYFAVPSSNRHDLINLPLVIEICFQWSFGYHQHMNCSYKCYWALQNLHFWTYVEFLRNRLVFRIDVDMWLSSLILLENLYSFNNITGHIVIPQDDIQIWEYLQKFFVRICCDTPSKGHF